MTEYEYKLTPRPQAVGGGWRLQLLEDGEEVGGGMFPGAVGLQLEDDAYLEAMDQGEEWLSTRPGADE